MKSKSCLKAGAFFAFLAVALGAFGAHGLKAVLTDGQLATFETGVRYQFYHALALCVVGFLMTQAYGLKLLAWAGYSFIVGIICFSGSLYLLAAKDILGTPGWVGPITPLGGMLFLIGWAMIFLAGFRMR